MLDSSEEATASTVGGCCSVFSAVASVVVDGDPGARVISWKTGTANADRSRVAPDI